MEKCPSCGAYMTFKAGIGWHCDNCHFEPRNMAIKSTGSTEVDKTKLGATGSSVKMDTGDL